MIKMRNYCLSCIRSSSTKKKEMKLFLINRHHANIQIKLPSSVHRICILSFGSSALERWRATVTRTLFKDLVNQTIFFTFLLHYDSVGKAMSKMAVFIILVNLKPCFFSANFQSILNFGKRKAHTFGFLLFLIWDDLY